MSDIYIFVIKNMKYRKLFKNLTDHIHKKEYSIITGARQTGKTTLMRQLERYCIKEDMPVIFINLENKLILTELNENPLNLLKFMPGTDKRIVVLIDEVQYLKDPSNFLKLLYDEHAENIKIIASGSSAFYIDTRFNDSLAGRKKIFYLPTCSFFEYLELAGKQELIEEIERLVKKPGLKSTLISYLNIEWEMYMIYGGYPAIITEWDKKEKVEKLKEIRDSFVKRDIEESGVGNETAFYDLLRILSNQIGNLVNVNELSLTLRIKNETVANYLLIMQKCFHIGLIKPFFRNLRKELVKMPKIYFLDTGLRNSLTGNFNPIFQRNDKGEIWENMVFRILSDKYSFDEIRYWRTSTGNELDFVLPYIDEPKSIEAKFDKNQIKTSKYKKFTDTYPDIPLSFAWMHPFNGDFFYRLKNI